MAAKVTLLLLRLGIGLLFLYTGAMKAWDVQGFAFAIESYRLTGPALTTVLAFFLPWLEIVAALGVLARRLYLGALSIIGAMLLLFTGAIGSAWWRQLDITCGCFGPAENRTNYGQHIAMDLALLAVVAVLFIAEARRRAP